MSFSPDTAAEALMQARRGRQVLAALPTAVAPRTEAEGVAAQHALAARMDALPPAGFKIGATARRMQEYLGLNEPAAGFMASANLHSDGARLRWADYVRVGVECELAVRLAHDLPPGPCTEDQAAEAVAALVAAIEVVENRYGDLPTLGTPTLIADQVFHAAAVVGPDHAGWRDLDPAALPGRIETDGTVRDTGFGRDLLGHPMRALAWLAGSSLAAAFGGLKAGQVVMLGSVTPPVWLDAPCRVAVHFPPLPSVTLQFA